MIPYRWEVKSCHLSSNSPTFNRFSPGVTVFTASCVYFPAQLKTYLSVNRFVFHFRDISDVTVLL